MICVGTTTNAFDLGIFDEFHGFGRQTNLLSLANFTLPNITSPLNNITNNIGAVLLLLGGQDPRGAAQRHSFCQPNFNQCVKYLGSSGIHQYEFNRVLPRMCVLRRPEGTLPSRQSSGPPLSPILRGWRSGRISFICRTNMGSSPRISWSPIVFHSPARPACALQLFFYALVFWVYKFAHGEHHLFNHVVRQRVSMHERLRFLSSERSTRWIHTGSRLAPPLQSPICRGVLRLRRPMLCGSWMDLSRSTIGGANYITLSATNHFAGSTGATITAPNMDINLGSTNGNLAVNGLVAPSVSRFDGVITMYSARWTNIVAGFTNEFHVLIVNSGLAPSAPVIIQNLGLRSTNVTISDIVSITNSLLINAQNLTLTTNAVGAPNPTGEIILLNNNISGRRACKSAEPDEFGAH